MRTQSRFCLPDLQRSTSPGKTPTRPRRRLALLVGCVLAAFMLWTWRGHDMSAVLNSTSFRSTTNIPNLAHFVHQVNRTATGDPEPLHFDFRNFMAYWSALHYLEPDQLNIWTDATAMQIEEAQSSPDPMTRAVANLPGITFRYMEMPTRTSRGVPIVKYAHRSDFVRSRVMEQYGGIYMDDDLWVLKDLAPFRESGFDNVFGRQQGGELCQAMWMSKPGNDFMAAWTRLQEIEFTGAWTKASNKLISRLVEEFAGTGHNKHALIVERETFFPGSWKQDAYGLNMMYELHEDDGLIEEDRRRTLQRTQSTVDDIVASYTLEREAGWRYDWRLTNSIHGWSNGIKSGNLWHYFGSFGSLTPEYVLSGRSNVARALYPALKAALDRGYLVIA